jgi:hypothetical protein
MRSAGWPDRIQIATSEAAFAAMTRTMALGSGGYENAVKAPFECGLDRDLTVSVS